MKDCQITHFLKWTLPLAAALALAGRASHRPVDVSDQLAWWANCAPAKDWSLLRTLFSMATCWNCQRAKPPSQATARKKSTAPMLPWRCSVPTPWVGRPNLYLLPEGTDLRCVKLERWFSDEGALYRVSVEILSNGDHQGKIAFLIPWGDPNKKGSLELGPHSLVRPEEVATANGR